MRRILKRVLLSVWPKPMKIRLHAHEKTVSSLMNELGYLYLLQMFIKTLKTLKNYCRKPETAKNVAENYKQVSGHSFPCQGQCSSKMTFLHINHAKLSGMLLTDWAHECRFGGRRKCYKTRNLSLCNHQG